jgi:hypothetical protein
MPGRGAVRILIAALATALGATGPAASNPLVSVVYCAKGARGGASYFAAQEGKDGKLQFSVSVWSANGQMAGLLGAAEPSPGGWTYRSNAESSKPGQPCIAEIRIDAKLGARITPRPLGSCDGGQGEGAELGDVVFSASAFAGRAPNANPSVNEDDLGPRCDELTGGQ